MKCTRECYPCLAKLVRQAASLSTQDPVLQQQVLDQGLQTLQANFGPEQVSITIAGKLHQLIKDVSGDPDPYRLMKEQEMQMASRIAGEMTQNWTEGLLDCLRLAALGNSLDFFRPLETVYQEMQQAVTFARDDSAALLTRLQQARTILYLADNAGEVFFDLPLLQYLRRQARVTYVLKEQPVQNDFSLAELNSWGLATKLKPVLTTGSPTPGLDLAQASTVFRQEFIQADLIIAKGMGNYEALSELPPVGRILYCLKAKCQPVADVLGVPIFSFVVMLH